MLPPKIHSNQQATASSKTATNNLAEGRLTAGKRATPSSAAQSSTTMPNTAIQEKVMANIITSAQVVNTQKINTLTRNSLRQQLHTQIKALEQQLNRSNPLNTKFSAIKLEQLQLEKALRLLETPQLFLSKLRIGRKIQAVFTEQKLGTGHTIKIQQQYKDGLKLLNNAGIKAFSEKTPSDTTGFRLNTAQSLQQALRHSLPQQQSQKSLFKLLRQIDNTNSLAAALPKPLSQAIEKLQKIAQLPQNLTLNNNLRQAILNSGTLLEGKIAKSLQQSIHLSANLSKLKPNSISSSTQGKQSVLTQEKIPLLERATLRDDFKLLLAQTLKLTDTHIQTESPKTTTAAFNKNSTDSTRNSSSFLSRDATTTKNAHIQNTAELSIKQQQIQLIVLLHRQLLGSMARVQNKQVQSLTQRPEGAVSLQFEIPIRWGDDIQMLEFRLEEKTQQESQKKSKALGVSKRWRISLSFDLPDNGQFNARIDVIDTHIKAKLWVENETTFTLAQQQLKKLQRQLQEQGLTIEKLECLQGKPEQPQIPLSYQLVDIKT